MSVLWQTKINKRQVLPLLRQRNQISFGGGAENGKKKIRQLENREKMLRQKLSREERRTHSHRLSPSCLDERGSAGLSEKTHRGWEKQIIPLERRAQLYTGSPVRCVLRSPLQGADDLRKRFALFIQGERCFPLRWLMPATTLQACKIYLYLFG